ncbi:MAG: VWA domain-containing protein [Geminicoccaceae bacterium]
MQPTRFAARARGPAERLAGFMAHLRRNGIAVGPAETARALAGLAAIDATDPGRARLALKTLVTSTPADWIRFDELFDAYWLNTGRVRTRVTGTPLAGQKPPALWLRHLPEMAGSAPAKGVPTGAAAGGDGDPADDEGEGRLVATRRPTNSGKDLRSLMSEAELGAAEQVARRLARAIRERHARRRRLARLGPEIDLRRTLRRSLARGGEPLDLARRRRREPPLRIVALLDVSGSMTVHARVFLAFLKGLVGADSRADAYLFHTSLVRVTEALTSRDALTAATRLSLLTRGMGGGTRIGQSLETFNTTYARRAVNGRTAVLILSDGYDTDPPEQLARALARLRRRARRIVWLNPLKGWRGYAPVARGMAAAMPHLDAFLEASTLASLAALEAQFRDL